MEHLNELKAEGWTDTEREELAAELLNQRELLEIDERTGKRDDSISLRVAAIVSGRVR